MKLSNIMITPLTANIFCDASTTPLQNDIVDACYGAVAFNMNDKIAEWYRVIHDTTTNHAELRGINLAVNIALILRNNGRYNHFNIFSDSKVSVYGMRDYCKRWLNVNNTLYTIGRRTPVASQDVYVETIKTIVDNDLYVSIWHQNGHVQTDRFESIDHAMRTFEANNLTRADADLDFIKYISEKNNYVDTMTRETLMSTNVRKKDYIEPIYFIPYQFKETLDRYEEIQERGENLC